MRRATLKDIADKVGVSQTLVSFVVRDKPDGYGRITIRPDLREKIKTVAQELNYSPHRSARILRTGKSRLIGVLSAHSSHPLGYLKTSEICQGILRRDYDYILQELEYTHSERLSKAIDLISDYSVDGVILVNLSLAELHAEDISRLEASELPVVEATTIPHGNFPYVGTDYYTAAYEMAKGVIAKGRRNIYAVASQEFVWSLTVLGRIEGVRDACGETEGVSFTPFYGKAVSPEGDMETGYVTTCSLLESNRPDAIFYANDFLAFGGIRAIKDRGMRVPDDIAVCGFDGLEIARFADPPITTAVQPIKQIAERCVSMLFGMLSGEVKRERVGYVLPCEILFRESTG